MYGTTFCHLCISHIYNTPCLPPKIFEQPLFLISSEYYTLQLSQEKLNTMLKQNLGEQTKLIMRNEQVENGVLQEHRCLA